MIPKFKELNLLNGYRELLPPKLFQEEYNPPKTDGSGFMRKELQEATKLLQDAGWEFQEGVAERIFNHGFHKT